MASHAPNLSGMMMQGQLWDMQANVLNGHGYGHGYNPQALQAHAQVLLGQQLQQRQQQQRLHPTVVHQNARMPVAQANTLSGLNPMQPRANFVQRHQQPAFRAELLQQHMAPMPQASPDRLREFQNKIVALKASIEHERRQLAVHRTQNRDVPGWAETEQRHIQSLAAKRQLLPQMVRTSQEIVHLLGLPAPQVISQPAFDRPYSPNANPIFRTSRNVLLDRVGEYLEEQRRAKEKETMYKTEYTHPNPVWPGFTFDITLNNSEKLTNVRVLPAEMTGQDTTVLQLQCAGCCEPLVRTSSGVFSPDEDRRKRVWALQCGHVVDGACMERIGHGKETYKFFSPVPVNRNRPCVDSVQKKLSSSPSRKRKRDAAEAEHVYSCPVGRCSKVHFSWKVGGEWVPADNGMGAIAMFV